MYCLLQRVQENLLWICRKWGEKLENENKIEKTFSTPSGDKTLKQMQEAITESERPNAVFASAKQAFQLIDLTKT